MQDYVTSLQEELDEMRADMDALAKSGDNQELLHSMEERYHRVKALLNAIDYDEEE